MTAPDSPITAPGTLDTSTGEPTPDHVRILPPPGQQQAYARLLLAAAAEDPQQVAYHPPHFVVPREVAEDAGLLDDENPSPLVELHDRTVPFPPLYPAQEAHKMTPLSPPGERALPVAPNAAYKGPGGDPAEAPGDFLPKAEDAVRAWDSTGEGEGDPQGQLGAERREVEQDDMAGDYTNEFAVPGVERERSVVPAERHTGLAEAEVFDEQAAAELKAPAVDGPATDLPGVDDGQEQSSAEDEQTEAAELGDPQAAAEAAKRTVLSNAGVVPDVQSVEAHQPATTQGAVAAPSDGSDGAEAVDPEPEEQLGAYPLPATADDANDSGPNTTSGRGEGWDDGVEDMTIDEIKDKLATGQLDPARVRASEQAGRNRKGVLELVQE